MAVHSFIFHFYGSSGEEKLLVAAIYTCRQSDFQQLLIRHTHLFESRYFRPFRAIDIQARPTTLSLKIALLSLAAPMISHV